MKIVVLEADSVGKDVSWKGLARFGELVAYGTTRDGQIAERIRDADIVIPNKCKMCEQTMRDAEQLKLICEAATGYNNIDLAYCEKRGIPVTNVRAYSTEAVVQHTFALLLQVLEQLNYYVGTVESGEYGKGESFTVMGPVFHELKGMRMGIIGLGNIGRRVAEIATAFGMEVVYYSASGRTYDVPYEAVDFPTLLSTSDVVSCHAPLNNKTKGLMNRDSFGMMKRTAIFINAGRGPIVEEEALAQALERGQIQAAALDVFETEPMPESSPLRRIKNRDKLFMTPHIAWATVEARTRLVEDVEKSIEAFLNGAPRCLVTACE